MTKKKLGLNTTNYQFYSKNKKKVEKKNTFGRRVKKYFKICFDFTFISFLLLVQVEEKQVHAVNNNYGIYFFFINEIIFETNFFYTP